MTVEVRIQPKEDYYCLNFIPRNDSARSILQTFNDENTADIVFEVKCNDEATPVLFYAHKFVLQTCAKGSTLASLCEECDGSTPVPIVCPAGGFHYMLYHIYGGNITAVYWKEHARDFIDLADRYGVKNLKIEAEAWYVKDLKITVDNVIDALVYAEEKNCFLLKEVTTNFILNNASEVLASESFDNIPESKSFVREIILVATMNSNGEAKKNFEDPTHLSINELRARLHDKGKDFDGPRNRLISLLEIE